MYIDAGIYESRCNELLLIFHPSQCEVISLSVVARLMCRPVVFYEWKLEVIYGARECVFNQWIYHHLIRRESRMTADVTHSGREPMIVVVKGVKLWYLNMLIYVLEHSIGGLDISVIEDRKYRYRIHNTDSFSEKWKFEFLSWHLEANIHRHIGIPPAVPRYQS